jgi:hypothetical protein
LQEAAACRVLLQDQQQPRVQLVTAVLLLLDVQQQG